MRLSIRKITESISALYADVKFWVHIHTVV
jgi:hypothetical protein